jgi:hypothetical protein
MEIADSFRVTTPLDRTWNVLLDIEGIAPCLPGAQLQEVDGNQYRGIVKVKVGPITAQYKGTATLAEVDEPGRRIVLDASGRDTRGQGNAKASIVVTMNDDNGGTRVDVVTDLSITGKVAQFGRGVIGDVSTKLLAQFVENLERDVLTGDLVDLTATEDDEVADDDAGEAVAEAVAHRAEPAASPSGNGAAVRRVDHPEAAPVDLLEMTGSPLARRLAPLVGALVVVLVIRWALRRRRRRD